MNDDYYEDDPEEIINRLEMENITLRKTINDREMKDRILQARARSWYIFGITKTMVMFKNDIGELESIPLSLLPYVAENRSFDGEIKDDEEFIIYIQDGTQVCRVPKVLIDAIKDNSSVANSS
jgi:hypothetical protein